jgi:hypothetical protein
MNKDRQSRLEILAYKIWEEQGRPDGRHEENWAEAERRLRFDSDDASMELDGPASPRPQDTPGRSNPASSRQQTHPGQTIQTGSRELDSKATTSPRGRPR